jgi:hypothetical protein
VSYTAQAPTQESTSAGIRCHLKKKNERLIYTTNGWALDLTVGKFCPRNSYIILMENWNKRKWGNWVRCRELHEAEHSSYNRPHDRCCLPTRETENGKLGTMRDGNKIHNAWHPRTMDFQIEFQPKFEHQRRDLLLYKAGWYNKFTPKSTDTFLKNNLDEEENLVCSTN